MFIHGHCFFLDLNERRINRYGYFFIDYDQNYLLSKIHLRFLVRLIMIKIPESFQKKEHQLEYKYCITIGLLLIWLNLYEIVKGLYFHCSLSMCVFVILSLSVSEQNSSRRDAPIRTRFSLNGCLPLCLEPYWCRWLLVEGQGHNDAISIFSS